jgi:aspartate/methionine/tyrosine aminotransferase
MELPPFLLDDWLGQKHAANPPIEFDLGSSTGPVWTLREVLALGGNIEDLLDTRLFYVPGAGTAALREELASMSGVKAEEVLITTGGAEGLLILFRLAAEAGANIVLPSPGFPANDAIAMAAGLEIRRYRLRYEDNFQIDLDEIRQLADNHTKIVLINSPHNPSGAVTCPEQMRALAEFCAQAGIQLVADEVYHPIYHGASQPSATMLANATVLGDFSKALCLSGLRIGWIIERDPQRRAQYRTARQYFTVSSATLSESLGTFALQHREKIYARAQKIAGENLSLLDRFFAVHADRFEWMRPAGGMTIFPRLRNSSDTRPFCRSLMGRGVMVAPGDCFGAPEHFRLGFAASGEQFAQGMARFEEALAV